MKALRVWWKRFRQSKQIDRPTEVPDQASRERLLRDVLKYAEVALAYTEPCPECQSRADRVRRWKEELESELKTINARG
jgi:hypothetical protein